MELHDNKSDKNKAIALLSSLSDNNPIELYRKGTIYDYILNEPDKAVETYNKSLNVIRQKKSKDAKFIIDKLQDRVKLNKLYMIEKKDVLPIQEKLVNELFENIEQTKAIINTKKLKEKKEVPKWTSDSQNVHDSNINKELVKSYEKLKKTEYFWAPQHIKNYLSSLELDPIEKENLHQASQTLDNIEKTNSTIMILNDVPESVFISNVFNHIDTEKDTKKKKIMIDNFINNLKDCNENNGVCLNGRITRILSSLNTKGYDDTDSIGDFKSVQMINQEIYAKVGKKRNDIIEQLPKDIQTAYNNSDEKVVEKINISLNSEVDKILDEYKDIPSINIYQLKKDIIEGF